MSKNNTTVAAIINYFQNRTFEKTALHHQNHFQLLIAIILSARCKDAKVNMITPNLFSKFPNFFSLATAPISEIYDCIKSITYPNEKAKRLQSLGTMMIEKFDNKIPEDLETLTTLPGVGRKTANVFLATVYDKPCIAVDTHVKRVANRLQLVRTEDPVKIEFALYELFSEEFHNKVSTWLINFGRERCKALRPECTGCPFQKFCRHKQ